jgi:hypothetical protein
LAEGPVETYAAGQFYEITSDEIHQSLPEDGTVTLITRQHKTVPLSVSTFWPYAPIAEGAKPSEKVVPGIANAAVIGDVVSSALEQWF